MSIVAVDSITDASGGNTASINGIPLRHGVIDPENRIINGAFDFWQRGTSGTGGGYVAADRWQNTFNTGTVTQSRQAFAVGDTLGSNSPTYFLRQTVSGQSATGAYAITAQIIEGVRSYAGQTITVLGWARRSSGTGNMSVELYQSFGTGGTPSASVNAVAPAVTTLSATLQPFAVVINVPSIAGKTLGTNGNDFLALNFWTSAGSDFNARTNSLGLQTIGVDLWGIHIKLGVHTADATALYTQPELGPELARCQRYYETGLMFGQGGYSGASNWNLGGSSAFATQKRSTPTVGLTLTASGGYVSGLTTQAITDKSIGYNAVMSPNSGAFVFFSFTADAEL
jgi:hypothetical protein